MPKIKRNGSNIPQLGNIDGAYKGGVLSDKIKNTTSVTYNYISKTEKPTGDEASLSRSGNSFVSGGIRLDGSTLYYLGDDYLIRARRQAQYISGTDTVELSSPQNMIVAIGGGGGAGGHGANSGIVGAGGAGGGGGGFITAYVTAYGQYSCTVGSAGTRSGSNGGAGGAGGTSRFSAGYDWEYPTPISLAAYGGSGGGGAGGSGGSGGSASNDSHHSGVVKWPLTRTGGRGGDNRADGSSSSGSTRAESFYTTAGKSLFGGSFTTASTNHTLRYLQLSMIQSGRSGNDKIGGYGGGGASTAYYGMGGNGGDRGGRNAKAGERGVIEIFY